MQGITSRGRAILAITAGVLLASGCVDRLMVEPARISTGALSVSLLYSQQADSSAGWGAAYDSANHVWVQLSRGGTPFHEHSVAFAADSAETAVTLEVELDADQEDIAVAFELRRDADPLFRGDTTVVASAGTESSAPVSLDAVVAEIVVDAPEYVGSLGTTVPLTGAALFATGDTISKALEWALLDPAVIALDSTGAAVSVGNGTGRLVASYGTASDTIGVTVLVALAPVTLSTGMGHSCVVTESSSIQCWGSKWPGSIGDGEPGVHALAPTTALSSESFISVAAGDVGSTCGLTATGQVWCWGQNRNGQLGTGNNQDTNTPALVAGDLLFTAVAAGFAHVCGIAVDGAAYCWGGNFRGQLGDGTNTDRNVPTPVAGGRTYVALDAGHSYTCALDTTGQAWCWGANADGQLGDGTTTERTAPVAVSGGTGLRKLGTGAAHSCALTEESSLICWGANHAGKLGDGTQTPSSTPVAVATTTQFASVAAGTNHTCAVALDGTLYCWGYNGDGQIGDGVRTNRSAPTLVAGGHTFAAVAPAWRHTCGVRTDGAVYCWGSEEHGTVGNGEIGFSPVPVAVSGGIAFASIRRGMSHSCGLASSGGGIYCWGEDTWGSIGDGTGGGGDPTGFYATPYHTSSDSSFVSLDSGWNQNCALTDAGAVWCWGSTLNQVTAPEAFTKVSNGGHHACAVGASGAAYCWGSDAPLGDGTTNASSSPVLVDGGLTFTDISTAYGHSCGINDSGAAYCWGGNGSGQLGDGTTTDRLAPVPVSGGITFSSISAGVGTTCGLDGGGNAYCWGSNGSGQLGDGTRNPSSAPVAVQTAETFASISTSGGITCAVTVAGDAYCWGSNHLSQLGSGDYLGQRETPQLVAGGHTWASVYAGAGGGCGVTTAGGSYCWGNRVGGVLGDGTSGLQLMPVPVAGGTAAVPDPQP